LNAPPTSGCISLRNLLRQPLPTEALDWVRRFVAERERERLREALTDSQGPALPAKWPDPE